MRLERYGRTQRKRKKEIEREGERRGRCVAPPSMRDIAYVYVNLYRIILGLQKEKSASFITNLGLKIVMISGAGRLDISGRLTMAQTTIYIDCVQLDD
jgi:hypothetical protein